MVAATIAFSALGFLFLYKIFLVVWALLGKFEPHQKQQHAPKLLIEAAPIPATATYVGQRNRTHQTVGV